MSGAEPAAGAYTIKALDAGTWSDFEALAARHNGVWGGCWCMWFHPEKAEKGSGSEGNRVLKQQLVQADRAHAALVFDGAEAVAWCQYGPPAELPNTYHRKEYEASAERLPDYRLTCLFVDRRYRRKRVASVAVRGALELIGQAGGGVVEAYPRDTDGKKMSASFLYNGTRGMYEEAGWRYDRAKGQFNCVMVTEVPPG